MAKVNFVNQAESFMSETYFSQVHGNAQKKTRKWRYIFYFRNNEKKNSGKDLNKIEGRFAEGK